MTPRNNFIVIAQVMSAQVFNQYCSIIPLNVKLLILDSKNGLHNNKVAIQSKSQKQKQTKLVYIK